ncbi:MAG: zinc finger domain-containing protein [Syntrophobacteraceae bacterium]
MKPALMDQGIMAGIGNLYSDEILFQACIHPKARVSELDEQQLKTIFNKMKKTLRTAVEHDAELSSFPAGYLLRNRKEGAECPACGRKLQTAKVGGRTAYFCPSCQVK